MRLHAKAQNRVPMDHIYFISGLQPTLPLNQPQKKGLSLSATAARRDIQNQGLSQSMLSTCSSSCSCAGPAVCPAAFFLALALLALSLPESLLLSIGLTTSWHILQLCLVPSMKMSSETHETRRPSVHSLLITYTARR